LLIYKTILSDKSLIAFWNMEESEEQLRAMCKLTDYDNSIIGQCSAPKRRIELLSVRAMLKAVGIDQTIRYDNRKPYLDKGYVSISHSNSIAAIIWHPDHPVGIDIEAISPKIQKVATRVFSDDEIAAAGNDLEKLTVLWNCKECVFKLSGDEGIDFRKMIRINLPSEIKIPAIDSIGTNSPNIECLLEKAGKTTNFSLSAMRINNHTAAFGIKL